MTPLTFEIKERSTTTHARVGRVTTLHGSFDTPAFMPVGTRGTVKGILPGLVRQTGAQILLNNTYHMLLRPGPELVQKMGGVHRFMNWDGPILTDSGGYQAYSMADMNAVDDDGVTFKSIVDGAMVRLTPERATQVQNMLGPDILMAFDDCPPSQEQIRERERAPQDSEHRSLTLAAPPDPDPRISRVIRRDSKAKVYDHVLRVKTANERTVRWLERCKAAHARASEQSLFGIVQGGTDLSAREWCVERVCNIDLPGYAIGGVAVGEGPAEIARVVGHTAPLMPVGKPRYLMGVGYERDILAAVRAGVDMFDCVLPTRNGRNANAFTPSGQMRLRNAKFAQDQGVIDATCDCVACAGESGKGGFSRGYIRHLFMAEEMLGPILVSLHNLRHFQRFMSDLRTTIATDDWSGLAGRWPAATAGAGAGLQE
ncbi:MAG: tRNA guanosine(34) transglycosylase Tgt [Planctomycetota bacterium]